MIPRQEKSRLPVSAEENQFLRSFPDVLKEVVLEDELFCRIQPKFQSERMQKMDPDGTIYDWQNCLYQFCPRNREGWPFIYVHLFIENKFKEGTDLLLEESMTFKISLPSSKIYKFQHCLKTKEVVDFSFEKSKCKIVRFVERVLGNFLKNQNIVLALEESWKKEKGITEFVDLRYVEETTVATTASATVDTEQEEVDETVM